MKRVAGIIVLNEEDHIGRNLAQHYGWFDKIVVVEGADRHYPADAVTSHGLSRDCTAEIVRDFPDPERKLTFIQHGWAGDGREGSGKVELRQRYAECFTEPAIFVHIDADEFYTLADQARIDRLIDAKPHAHSFRLPTVHFWHTPSQIITGGYYSIPHTRIFRWMPGTHYRWTELSSHNWPRGPRSGNGPLCSGGDYLVLRKPREIHSPEFAVRPGGAWEHPGIACYHFGFCRPEQEVAAKNAYYAARGETTSRPDTIRSRSLFFDPSLRKEEEIHPWGGCIPESFTDFFEPGGRR